MREVLIAMYVKYNKSTAKILEALKNKEPMTEEELQRGRDYEKGKILTTIIDDNYPEVFTKLPCPPIVFDCKEYIECTFMLVRETADEMMKGVN